MAWLVGLASVQCEAFALKVRIAMGKLRFVTAGESHGAGILAWLSGLPAGLPVNLERVNLELRRRQLGYGRGGRQKIEKDAASPEYIITISGVGYMFNIPELLQ